MSCTCETYQCLEAYMNPCSEGVQLNVLPSYSGNMTVRVWMNGLVRTVGVGVVMGEKMIVPKSILNENYTHELRLYSDDDLLGCYQLKTSIDLNSPIYPVPEIEYQMNGKEYTGNGTDTQTFPEIDGKQLLSIAMNGQEYTSDFWVQTGTSVTWDDPYMIFTGTVVLNWINA